MNLQEFDRMHHIEKLNVLFGYIAMIAMPNEQKDELKVLIEKLYTDTLTDAYDCGKDQGFDKGYEVCKKDSE